MATAVDAPPTPPVAAPLPQSTSRYRTLRGKSISSPRLFDIFRDDEARKDPPPAGSDQQESTPTRRSRSGSIVSFRGMNAKREKTPEVPPLPSFALTPKPVNIPAPPKLKARDGAKRPPQATPPTVSVEQMRPVTAPSKPTPAPATYKAFPTDIPPTPVNNQEDAKENDLAEQEAAERSRQEQDDKWADEVKRVGAETDRIASEQKKKTKKDTERLEHVLMTPPLKARRALLDKLSFFSRNKKLSLPTSSQPATPSTVATSAFSPNMSRGTSLETASSPPVSTILEPAAKDFGSHSLESSNTITERRVAVRCLSTTISLPVSQETSSVDIMSMASTMTRHQVNPSSAVVAESFLMLGLERRIRRYERIRDVMNTWDKDHENSLLILTSDADSTGEQAQDQDYDLDLDSVAHADETPTGFTLHMHQSSRPGKWNKRHVTLLGNGQILAAKHPDALPGDKDSILLCHMSDFDIYSAKEAEMRQSIKPPKRFCYAVKSQQPTSVFPEGENFVHFFSTDDEELAATFYERVHAWRSWYLANKHRSSERKRTAKAPRISFVQGKPASRMGDEPRESAKGADGAAGAGGGQSAFKFGTFEPLLDVHNLAAISEEASKLGPLVESAAEELVRQKRASDESKASAASAEKKAAYNTIVRASDRDPADDDLLGEVYDHLRSTGSHRRKDTATANVQQPVSEPSPEAVAANLSRQEQSEVQASPSPAPQQPTKAEQHIEAEPAMPQSEPRSWFPSAAEHTARLRSHPVHSSARRPATADLASSSSPSPAPRTLLQVPTATNGSSPSNTPQRRAKPSGLCINTSFPEPPRFAGPPQGTRPPQSPGSSPQPQPQQRTNFSAKIPGTPLPPPRGRFMPRSSSSGTLSQTSSPGGMRPRSRSTAGNSMGPRHMTQGGALVPPVPPLPSYSPRREQLSSPPQRPAPEPPRAKPFVPVPMGTGA